MSSKGESTRLQILERACDVASVEGLEGMTIGRLAELTSMSKSGLIRHFVSKERLQLAVIETAKQRFEEQVIQSSSESDPGLLRLKSLVRHWLKYLESGPYAGGCLWTQICADFDSRPGMVKDRVREIQSEWFEAVRHQVAIAMAKRQIEARGKTAEEFAFAVYAGIQQSIWLRQVMDRPDALTVGRRHLESVIGSIG